MRIKPISFIGLIILFIAFFIAFFGYRFYTSGHSHSPLPQPFTEQFVQDKASSSALDVKRATVLTDNDDTFTQKLQMIQTATESIDLAYYIYADDYSSSLLSQALIAAAQRGVRVRLLVDYQSTYAKFDVFLMLEKYGNLGKGSLQVRFYNRPSLNIIKDAVFLTLGCGEVNQQQDLAACSAEKYKRIENQFATDQHINPSNTNELLNYNNGQSGLFLSGFYAKNPRLMALAIQQGQALPALTTNLLATKSGSDNKPKNDAENNTQKKLDQLSKVIDIYMTARHGSGFDRVAANLKLKFAMTLFSGKISPYYDALTSYFPIGRSEPRAESLQDWNYITDYLHQKLLLVDGKRFVLGGRNVEDTYHMQAHPLMEQYQFMDTDVSVELTAKQDDLVNAFERLWQFQTMVATTKDVEQHAPNDAVASMLLAEKQCATLKDKPDFASCQKKLTKQALNKVFRVQSAYITMLKNVAQYRNEYRQPESSLSPAFAVDAEAESYYVENIPFNKQQKQMPLRRTYGAENGKEAQSGKYIHSLWLSALSNTCQQASAEKPQEVIIHNAYFFMPSNLLRQLGDMVSGKQACQHVHITILTNSPETTDLGIVNLVAKYSLKALVEHLETAREKGQSNGATLSYYEYQPTALPHGIKPSLHSKVMVFGDDLFIGSANADVRSYMMDANNGLLIRKAPQLVKNYRQWFHGLLADTKRTKDKTQYLTESNVDTWLANDTQQLLSSVQQKMGVLGDASSNAIPVSVQQQLGERLKALFNTIYRLSTESLSDKSSSVEAQQKFNALFKLI